MRNRTSGAGPGAASAGIAQAARYHDWRMLLCIPLFFALHLGYGAGFIRGVVKGLRNKGKTSAYKGGVTIRRVTIGGPDGS